MKGPGNINHDTSDEIVPEAYKLNQVSLPDQAGVEHTPVSPGRGTSRSRKHLYVVSLKRVRVDAFCLPDNTGLDIRRTRRCASADISYVLFLSSTMILMLTFLCSRSRRFHAAVPSTTPTTLSPSTITPHRCRVVDGPVFQRKVLRTSTLPAHSAL